MKISQNTGLLLLALSYLFCCTVEAQTVVMANSRCSVARDASYSFASGDKPVTAWAISPSGEYVAVGFDDGTVEVVKYDNATGSQQLSETFSIANLNNSWAGTPSENWINIFGAGVTGLSFVDNAHLVCAIGSGRIVERDILQKLQTATTDIAVPIAAMDAVMIGSEARVILGSDRGRIEERALTTGLPLLGVYRPGGVGDPEVFSLSYFSAGSRLFSSLADYHPDKDVDSGQGGTLSNGGPTIWDTANRQRVARLGAPDGNVTATECDGGAALTLLSEGGELGRATTAEGFTYHALRRVPVMGVATLGTTPESLLGVNPSQLLVMDVPTGKILLRGTDAAGEHVQRGVLSTLTDDKAVVVRQGGCAIYTITRSAAGAPTAIPRNEPLGSHLGFDFAITHELRGHDSRCLEVQSTSDGAYVASRDDKGSVILWSRSGASYAATVLPFNVGAAPRAFSRLSFSQWGLTAVMPDGSVQVVEFPFSGVCNCKVFFEDNKQITAVTALRISGDEILLGLDDGRLCKASLSSEQITSVVVDPGSTSRTFRHLLYSPVSQRVAAVPDRVLDPGLAISVLSVPNCQVVAEIRNRWKLMVAAIDGAGRLLVSALGKHGVFFYDLAGSTSLVARFPKRARVGVAAFDDKLVLAADRMGLRLVKYESGIYGMDALSFPHLPASSVAGAPSDDAVFIGTDSGPIFRVAATPTP